MYVPARICAVKTATQQAMIDDLGFLKGGRFRVVHMSELFRYSGASTKKKWCPTLMKEYLEYISQYHSSTVAREEEKFLKKILNAVKEKDHDSDGEDDDRDDEASELSDVSTEFQAKKHEAFVDRHGNKHAASVDFDVRDQPETTTHSIGAISSKNTIGAFQVPTERLDTSYVYDVRNNSYFAKHQERSTDTRVKFDLSGEARTMDAPERVPVKEVLKHATEAQADMSDDKSGLDATTWWVVLRGSSVKRGATPLVNRCMRTYGWNESYTNRVLAGYKQFCAWKKSFEDWDDTALAPPVPIRKMWQQHLLDSRNYQADCQLLFGKVLQYNPDNGADTDKEKERIENAKRVAHVRFRGADYDEDVWNWEEQETEIEATRSNRDMKVLVQEARKELKPVPQHPRLYSQADNVSHSMREALALLQEARKNLKTAPQQSRPDSFQIIPSSCSDSSSASRNNIIRLRIVGNGKDGLRSASIKMDYSGSFDRAFQEYASEYAIRVGKPRVFLRFLTKNGQRISESDTPEKLRLMNDDEITAVQSESDRSSWI